MNGLVVCASVETERWWWRKERRVATVAHNALKTRKHASTSARRPPRRWATLLNPRHNFRKQNTASVFSRLRCTPSSLPEITLTYAAELSVLIVTGMARTFYNSPTPGGRGHSPSPGPTSRSPALSDSSLDDDPMEQSLDYNVMARVPSGSRGGSPGAGVPEIPGINVFDDDTVTCEWENCGTVFDHLPSLIDHIHNGMPLSLHTKPHRAPEPVNT